MLQRFSSCFCPQIVEFQVSKLELGSVSQLLISSLPHPLTPSSSGISSVCDSPLSQLWGITEELFGSAGLARCLTYLNMSQYSAVRCHLVTEGNLYLYSNKKILFWFTLRERLSLFKYIDIILIMPIKRFIFGYYRQDTYNVALRRFCATIVAVEKQWVLQNQGVYLEP